MQAQNANLHLAPIAVALPSTITFDNYFLGVGRGYTMQQDVNHIAMLQQKPAAERGWRMQQTLLSWQETLEALVSLRSWNDAQARKYAHTFHAAQMSSTCN